MVHDAIGLDDELKDLMKELKVMVEDSKQAAINVKKGEAALADAKKDLNEVLKQRKLVVKNGTLEPLREKESTFTLDTMDTSSLVAQAE